MEVQEEDRSPRRTKDLIESLQELPSLPILRQGAGAGRGLPSETVRRPEAVQVPGKVPAALGQGGPVPGQRNEITPEAGTSLLETLQHPAQGKDTGCLVPVQPTETDEGGARFPASEPPQDALHPGKGAGEGFPLGSQVELLPLTEPEGSPQAPSFSLRSW